MCWPTVARGSLSVTLRMLRAEASIEARLDIAAFDDGSRWHVALTPMSNASV